ncbi:hypothetical protein ST37_19220 [Vibrio sp. qd031]|uniref:hypothetical protein n=1 Tax=Vibrio sp. qd031 TaxID=1603038 RepID=UPI000A0F8FB0|nr:hypothetical protein [Vibrio sp. qd031]ORT48337.1 hypothetical protein ST37_19220 [Vibrio sp. qd031]
MINVIKELFIPKKDYAGRDIDVVIERLALQTNSTRYDWSYIKEESVYENTTTGSRVYPHELSKHAA